MKSIFLVIFVIISFAHAGVGPSPKSGIIGATFCAPKKGNGGGNRLVWVRDPKGGVPATCAQHKCSDATGCPTSAALMADCNIDSNARCCDCPHL